MDKRLMKRHKRQVARARQHVKLSEPDVRTPEQIKAAREASRPTGGSHSDGPSLHSSGPSVRTSRGATGSAAKTDAG
jgi:hypothetical protein